MISIYICEERVGEAARLTVKTNEATNLPGRKSKRAAVNRDRLLPGKSIDDLIIARREILISRRRTKREIQYDPDPPV